MTEGPAPQHRGAHRWRGALGLVLALTALVTGWRLVADFRALAPALWQWPHHPARVQSLADDDWLELEVPERVLQVKPALRQPAHPTPGEEGHVRVLVPRPRYEFLGMREAVTLAVDEASPHDASRVRVLDTLSLAVPPVAKLVLLALLAWGWRLWPRLPWGRDETWGVGLGGAASSGGSGSAAVFTGEAGWVETHRQAARVGFAANAADELREPAAYRRATRFWAGFIALATAAVGAQIVFAWHEAPIETTAFALLVAAIDIAFVHAFVSTRTRRVRFDAEGVADASYFQTRRVPWAAMAAFERTNVNAEAQRSYDARPAARRSGSRRPPDNWKWIARAADGTELLRLPAELESEPAFRALAARIRRQQRGLVPRAPDDTAAVEADEDAENDDDEATLGPAQRAALEAHRAEWTRLEAQHARMARWMALVVLLPFVLAALAATWNGAYYAFFAARTEGRVVELPPGKLPSMVVAYRPQGAAAAGTAPLQIQSDGTAAYAHIRLGDEITVLYDPVEPQRARLDFFWEVWLWAVVGWALFALVALPMALIARSLRRTAAAVTDTRA